MRYSSALVLSTLAAGQAAAASIGHRHANFHARRHAEVKRTPGSEVNWDAVAVDLKDVDWDKINWSSVFNTPTPTPEAKPAPTTEQKPTTTAEAPKAAAVVPTQQPKAEAKVSTQSKDVVGGFISDLLVGVESVASKLGAKVGKNDKSNNGGIWVGGDSDWKMEFLNDNNQEAVVYCWKANGFSGMSINVNVPEISVGLKPGEKVQISFAPNVPAACAPAFPGSTLAIFGGLFETWVEATFGNFGAFDISRNVNMRGSSITAKGSKCTSDMNTCVFKCKNDSATSCEAGTDYDLYNCGASNGGGGGYDSVMKGTGGGCAMGGSGETIQVTLH